MIEFQDIGDLRPAPRQAPDALLWLMLAVALALGALLIGSRPDAMLRAVAVPAHCEADPAVVDTLDADICAPGRADVGG